ncbi:MAG TPA: hypothetical protein VN962_20350, partial [Polyangia bacterium]|nr:hypothetical protein [Polyangia bacterium]
MLRREHWFRAEIQFRGAAAITIHNRRRPKLLPLSVLGRSLVAGEVFTACSTPKRRHMQGTTLPRAELVRLCCRPSDTCTP